MTDPSQINSTITKNIYTNNAGKITGAVLASVLVAITGWVAATFAPITNPTFLGAVTLPGGTVATNLGYTPANAATTISAGANSNITSLSGLTTPLSIGQGGVGNATGALDSLTVGGKPLPTKLSGVHSIAEVGSPCNGTADDSAAVQNWINALAAGSTITLPQGYTCSFLTANLTVPSNISIYGSGGISTDYAIGANPNGSGFYFKPPYHMVLGSRDDLHYFFVYRSVADGHFHISPTILQAEQDEKQWWTEQSVGIQHPINQGGNFLDHIDIVGFHVGVLQQSGLLDWDGLRGDCTTLIALFQGGDLSYGTSARAEPYYGINLPQTSGAWQRYGPAFYITGGINGGSSAAHWSKLQAEGWPQALVVEGGGNNIIDDIGYEYPANWNPGNSGFPAENYGVVAHYIDAGDQNFLSKVGVGTAGSNGLLYGGIDIDQNSSTLDVNTAKIEQIPSGGFSLAISGGTAAPVVMTVSSVPAVGTAITITLSGTTLSAVGGPFTYTYTVQAGDTAASIAQWLSYLINTQYSAPGFAHVVSDQRPYGSGVFGIYWPADGTVTVANTGGAITQTTGTAASGSQVNASNIDMTVGNSAFITIGNTAQNALAVTLSNILYDNGTVAPISSNWLVLKGPNPNFGGSTRLRMTNVQHSPVFGSNISACGTGANTASPSFDDWGSIVEGTSATSCTVTFSTPWPHAPQCTFSGGPVSTTNVTTTGFTFYHASQNNVAYTYSCDLRLWE